MCIHVQGTLDTASPVIITGTVDRGRFGSAIVNIGDINSDGFEGGDYMCFSHSLTLGALAQRGLLLFVCLSVCVSASQHLTSGASVLKTLSHH